LGIGHWGLGIGHWALGIGNRALVIGNSPHPPSSFFLLPSSFFLLPSSFFLLPSSLFLLPSNIIPEATQLCTFFVDNLFLGIEVEKVQEIIRYQEMTRVPLAPAVVGGLINLRGQIVTAIDLRRRLDLSDRPAEQLPLNAIVRVGDETISLLVDDIGDVLEVYSGDFETPPDTFTSKTRSLIRGAYKLEGQLLLFLDVDKVADFAASH
jgi:purine-binding chemotaxis protein CheW